MLRLWIICNIFQLSPNCGFLEFAPVTARLCKLAMNGNKRRTTVLLALDDLELRVAGLGS